MAEIARICNLLTRAFEGEAWHGPSLRELLADVAADEAAARPLPGAHTIWELVLHISAWEAEAARRLDGHPPRDLPSEEDWPPVPAPTDANWIAALERLEAGHRELRRAMSQVPESRLEQDLGGAGGARWTYYTTMHGVIQHDLYHAGQIAVLKKALARL